MNDAQHTEYHENIAKNTRIAVELAREGKDTEAMIVSNLAVSTAVVDAGERLKEITQVLHNGEGEVNRLNGVLGYYQHRVTEFLDLIEDSSPSDYEQIKEQAAQVREDLELRSAEPVAG